MNKNIMTHLKKKIGFVHECTKTREIMLFCKVLQSIERILSIFTN